MPAEPVACLVGPTGVGKSEVGIRVARALGAEIVCCDAYTVYRGMPILTAAPSPPGDVPHRLLGIVGPDETYDAARFLTDADYEVARIRERGRRPLLVGGAALYLRCWLKGFDAEAPRDEAYRARLARLARVRGPGALYERLRTLDPGRARELHPNDLRRVVRALEIVRATGRPASAQRLQWSGPDRVLARVVGLRRDLMDLDARIARRTRAMFEAGVLEEARALLAAPLSPQAAQVLGLQELRRVLAGEWSAAEAEERIAQRTRRYARKQLTFFGSFADLVWVDAAPGENEAALAPRVLAALALPSS